MDSLDNSQPKWNSIFKPKCTLNLQNYTPEEDLYCRLGEREGVEPRLSVSVHFVHLVSFVNSISGFSTNWFWN